MAGARSKAIIPVVVLLTLAALGGGGWFGYRYLLDTRAGLAIKTAADFELAGRDGDADEWAGFLPPGFADELKDDELEAGIGYFGTSWEHDDRETADGVITDTYLNTDRDTFEDYDLIAEWELDGDASLTRATVIAAVEWGPPEGERGEADIIIDLVWLDGAWRVARYECTDGSNAEFTFWDEDEDADDLAEEYLEYLADKGYRLDGDGAPQLTDEQLQGGELPVPQLTEEQLQQGQLPGGHPAIGGNSGLYDYPEDVVTAHFDAIMLGDYATAYRLLPADKQAAMTEDEFAAQIAGYGITGFSVDAVVDNGDTAAVSVTMITPYGDFAYLWQLEWSGNTWVATGRELAGM